MEHAQVHVVLREVRVRFRRARTKQQRQHAKLAERPAHVARENLGRHHVVHQTREQPIRRLFRLFIRCIRCVRRFSGFARNGEPQERGDVVHALAVARLGVLGGVRQKHVPHGGATAAARAAAVVPRVLGERARDVQVDLRRERSQRGPESRRNVGFFFSLFFCRVVLVFSPPRAALLAVALLAVALLVVRLAQRVLGVAQDARVVPFRRGGASGRRARDGHPRASPKVAGHAFANQPSQVGVDAGFLGEPSTARVAHRGVGLVDAVHAPPRRATLGGRRAPQARARGFGRELKLEPVRVHRARAFGGGRLRHRRFPRGGPRRDLSLVRLERFVVRVVRRDRDGGDADAARGHAMARAPAVVCSQPCLRARGAECAISVAPRSFHVPSRSPVGGGGIWISGIDTWTDRRR